MMIPLIDAILLICLSGFVFYGLFFGFIRTVGMFAGVIAGAALASRLYLPVSEWINPVFFGYSNLGKVLVFIILFTLINRIVGFIFYLIDKAFKIVSIIPFLKTFNRLGGAALGFISGGLFIGLILYVSSRYALIDFWFGQWLTQSQIAPMMIKFTKLLLPLLPEMLKKLQALI